MRTDYCRMRLPFRAELKQPAGVVHGGAIAALLDTRRRPGDRRGATAERGRFATVDMHVQYLDALRSARTLVAEGWIVRRGRRDRCSARAEATRPASHRPSVLATVDA